MLTLALWKPKRFGLEQGDLLPPEHECAYACNLPDIFYDIYIEQGLWWLPKQISFPTIMTASAIKCSECMLDAGENLW